MRAFFGIFVIAAATGLNPITRVAQLLEGLAKKVEADGKQEEELYNAYKCWCNKVITSKTASVTANGIKIGELASYIDDLTNGRVELTTERVDLEAEIAELEKTIADGEAMRAKEKKDHKEAKREMDRAITALDSALTTLQSATANSVGNGGVLSSVTSQIKKVLDSNQGFLAKRDVDKFQKILDVPVADWKKLNQDATFKMKYAARSTDIQDILQDMYNTFVDNRQDAIDNEKKAAADSKTLLDAKRTSLGHAKQALIDKSKENGAQALALGEATSQKEDLEEQNRKDGIFMTQTRTSCNAKDGEWTARQGLRTKEIASIAEAISVLRSDDARDKFTKSFDSQSFMQVSSTKDNAVFHKALKALRALAKSTKDHRLAALSTLLTVARRQAPAADVTADPFRAVFIAIDNMVTILRSEEARDLQEKEYCEEARMNATQEAKILSKKIDTNTETIERYNAAVEANNKTIEDINNEIADLRTDKRDAKDQRTKENNAFRINKQDDFDAVAMIETAKGVLKKFYTDNGLSLAAKTGKVVRAHVADEPGTGGEAPPPPPSTWDASYGGSKDEHNGIIAILDLIKQDIEKDMQKADQEEKDAKEAFESLKTDIDGTILSLETRRGGLSGDVANDMGSTTTEKGARTSNQGDLDSKLLFLKQIAPGCDFIAMNFETRLDNRQKELDGLAQAKAILASADLSGA